VPRHNQVRSRRYSTLPVPHTLSGLQPSRPCEMHWLLRSHSKAPSTMPPSPRRSTLPVGCCTSATALSAVWSLHDGLFNAEDVLTHLDLHGPALLGACLLGQEHALQGLAGASTVSALHLVGCPSVLGALWVVQADATAQLLDCVRRTGGMGPGGWAEALRQAQLALRAQNTHSTDPTAWAAFTLYSSPVA
jgi:hypothetical protein